MSLEAMLWALKEAPGVPPQCVGALMGLAECADKQGRGAFIAQAKLASYARKSDRQVRSDLTKLTELGIIRRGNQHLAAHIPGDARPVVYDLAMDRKPTSGRNRTSARQSASARQDTLSDVQEQEGTGSLLPGGSTVPAGSTASRERKPASDKPTTTQEMSSTKTSTAPGPHVVADQLAAAYWDRHKSATAQPFLAVRGVVRTAIANGLGRDDVARVIDQLAREGTALSGATVTNKLRDLRNPQSPNGHRPYRNPADQADYDGELRVQ